MAGCAGLCAFEVDSGRELFRVEDAMQDCPLDAADDADDERPEDWVLLGTVHPVVAEGLVWMPRRREHEDDGLHEHPEPWTGAEVAGFDPRTGELRWRYVLDPGEGSEITDAVTVAAGTLLFPVVHWGHPDEPDTVPRFLLHAVDVATRFPQWTHELPEPAVGAPVVDDGPRATCAIGLPVSRTPTGRRTGRSAGAPTPHRGQSGPPRACPVPAPGFSPRSGPSPRPIPGRSDTNIRICPPTVRYGT
jgi:hypothetical protein